VLIVSMSQPGDITSTLTTSASGDEECESVYRCDCSGTKGDVGGGWGSGRGCSMGVGARGDSACDGNGRDDEARPLSQERGNYIAP
jgi:hypothetical protein